VYDLTVYHDLSKFQDKMKEAYAVSSQFFGESETGDMVLRHAVSTEGSVSC
jgi:hypothetical protein